MAIFSEGVISKWREKSRESCLKQARDYKFRAKYLPASDLKATIKIYKQWLKDEKLFPKNSKEYKELESIIEYLEEALKEKESSNNSNSNSSSTKNNNSYLMSEKDISDTLKSANKIIQKYNQNKDIQNRVLKYLDDLYKDDQEDNPKKFYKFICNEFDSYDSEIIIEVCDRDQDYIMAVSDIIYEIGKELEKEVNNKNYQYRISVHTGDGDEGCLYVAYNQK